MKTETLKIKLPKIEQVEFETICHSEETQVRGNAMASGDEKADKRAEDRILRQLENGNQWAWCTIEVKASYKGLTASDFLGCCSYKSQKDFEKDVYYVDMKKQAFDSLIEQIKTLAK